MGNPAPKQARELKASDVVKDPHTGNLYVVLTSAQSGNENKVRYTRQAISSVLKQPPENANEFAGWVYHPVELDSKKAVLMRSDDTTAAFAVGDIATGDLHLQELPVGRVFGGLKLKGEYNLNYCYDVLATATLA
ncbi:hypothetical protein ACFP1Z_32675 [Streptomyces gamaensis]|uniref:Uncharacterized protein n=1 Tax=Streptomyces gamaensis TaxID=1763542 RepID=A0ABW0ZAT0_9ACTN